MNGEHSEIRGLRITVHQRPHRDPHITADPNLEHCADELCEAGRAVQVDRDVGHLVALHPRCAERAQQARQARHTVRRQAGDEDAVHLVRLDVLHTT